MAFTCVTTMKFHGGNTTRLRRLRKPVKYDLMETPGHISSLRVIGGNLALDFANTAEGTSEGEIEQEHLLGYEDLVFWGHRVEYLSAEDGERLLRKGDERPAEADTVFASALGFRGHLRGLFRAVAGGDNPPAESVEALRRFESEAISRAALVPTGAGFVWKWALGEDLAGVLWPVAHSATELLISGPLGRVKGCAGCNWLFVDESKNRSRRWCAMEDCGTHAKVRRYVARRAAKRKS
jgi:predicted RNA-binding Zn ribbon-like protein